MYETVTNSCMEFNGLGKTGDVWDSHRQPDGIQMTVQNWRHMGQSQKAGWNSTDWSKLEMYETVTDSWMEFNGLDKIGDIRDSNKQLDGIQWTGQNWRCMGQSQTAGWNSNDCTKLETYGTVTDSWMEFN